MTLLRSHSMSLFFRLKQLHFITSGLRVSVFLLLLLNACQLQNNPSAAKTASLPIIRSTVAANFGSDGRLWRLIPTSDAVYIDYSDNNGQTFSQPVQVNPASQKISAWPENPPAIAVSRSGRIHVLYYADEAQKSTSYYSYSDDGGKTFSMPMLVSDHADSAMHYMDKMLLDNEDKVYLFWHDRRHELLDQQLGSGVLSLYYTISGQKHEGFENRFVSGGICSCCRTATALSSDNKPVILARMVFPEGVREHALIHMDENGDWNRPVRVTTDRWTIEACPEHGPALSIDKQGRSHLAWFTLGNVRQGIFYAQTDDYGINVSKPMAIGDRSRLPGHPDILALNDRVALTWKEFDGENTYIRVQESYDRGAGWSTPKTVFKTAGDNGHPHLISNGQAIFLSWMSSELGYKILQLE